MNRKKLFVIFILLVIIFVIIASLFLFYKKETGLFSFFSKNFQNKSELNEKITWKKLDAQNTQNEYKGGETTSVSAMCLEGTECSDTIVTKQTDTPNYYQCTLDEQCSFFKGFTGIKTELGEQPKTNAPAEARRLNSSNAINPTNPTLPNDSKITSTDTTQTLPQKTDGKEDCFNKDELLKNALNPNQLEEVPTNICECGIMPPSFSVTGTPTSVDASTGEVEKAGTIRKERVQTNEDYWVCMRPTNLPDLAIENLTYPTKISLGEPFLISLNYKNVGLESCLETFFQLHVTRTIDGQIENLGGSEAHILSTPFLPNEIRKFDITNKFLPVFDVVGEYEIKITNFCEWPRETHIVNGLKKINISVLK